MTDTPTEGAMTNPLVTEEPAPAPAVHVAEWDGLPGGAEAAIDPAAGHLVITPSRILAGGERRFPLDAVPDWLLDRYPEVRAFLLAHLGIAAPVTASETAATAPEEAPPTDLAGG